MKLHKLSNYVGFCQQKNPNYCLDKILRIPAVVTDSEKNPWCSIHSTFQHIEFINGSTKFYKNTISNEVYFSN